MPQVVWTPVAESDLDDILYQIAFVDRRFATGQRIYYEIRDKMTGHVAQSRPGQRHQSAPEGWLYVRHKRWLIFYQPHPDGIEVMRVIDSARDLPRQLRDD